VEAPRLTPRPGASARSGARAFRTPARNPGRSRADASRLRAARQDERPRAPPPVRPRPALEQRPARRRVVADGESWQDGDGGRARALALGEVLAGPECGLDPIGDADALEDAGEVG